MKASFWHACWQKNSLGFHQKSIHPFLRQYLLPRLTQSDQSVFVPLCGKSDDMVWLADHMDVVGAELSEIACRDFFKDKQLPFDTETLKEFTKFSYKNISLFQGDFFELSAAQFSPFDWIYDRAAIIALPKSMQSRYVKHLASYLTGKTKLFLISLEFPQQELEGPPFALFEDDIRSLFAGFQIECVAEHELADKTFAQRTFDVSYLREKLYIISASDSLIS